MGIFLYDTQGVVRAAGLTLSAEFPPFLHSDALLSTNRSLKYSKDIRRAIELAYCVMMENQWRST